MVEQRIVSHATIDSPIGQLWLAATPKGLCCVGLPGQGREELAAWVGRRLRPAKIVQDAAALDAAAAQLIEYLNQDRQVFDLPLDVYGTLFQQQVWAQVALIPYGVTATYGEVARRLGRSLGAARAVGAAVGANPLPLVIPCHRVVGAGGALTGYGGGLEIKAALLRREGAIEG
ncbi:MAG: methylated-DNA--[protein]-cysteine S-methyltransferase [Anaerolineae bacterium]|nr:methylated-DNA--[protein]-cysteine S-methyltransferase [Anaerolineae bacterium]